MSYYRWQMNWKHSCFSPQRSAHLQMKILIVLQIKKENRTEKKNDLDEIVWIYNQYHSET